MARQVRSSRSANCTLIARPALYWPGGVEAQSTMMPMTCGVRLERVTRIELALSAWEVGGIARF
jgi:hypothetical protein